MFWIQDRNDNPCNGPAFPFSRGFTAFVGLELSGFCAWVFTAHVIKTALHIYQSNRTMHTAYL